MTAAGIKTKENSVLFRQRKVAAARAQAAAAKAQVAAVKLSKNGNSSSIQV